MGVAAAGGCGFFPTPNQGDCLPILVLRRVYYDQKGAFPRTVTLTFYSYQSLIPITKR